MAESTTLARPYARAAFELALRDQALGPWSSMLNLIAAVSAQPVFRSMLTDPLLPPEQLARSFIGVCGDELDARGGNFVRLLARNRRLALLPEIVALYEQMKANQEKVVDVEIRTSHDFNPDLAERFRQALGVRLQRTVNLEINVDRSLIGGAVIRAGDTVIDSSVRGKLARLSESMNA